MRLHSLFALVALPAGLVAQSPSTYAISPRGSEFFEGNSSSDIMLGNWAPQTRTQQIDNNLVGVSLPIITALGWRRNGTQNAGAAKTTDLTITMSHADYATVTNTFASNYKDPPQVVFARRPVNLPDWNSPSGSVPSPIDLVVGLDFPFVYNGVDALLWDVQNENNPQGIYTQDWVSGSMSHTYGAFPFDISSGCTTPNGSMNHRVALRANATTFEMGFVVRDAPSSTNVALLFGLQPASLPVPGLCAPLTTQPIANIDLGTTDASGNLPLAFGFPLAWSPNLAGIPLFTQAFAADPSQAGLPIALSNGLSSATPLLAGPGSINIKRIYHTSNATAVTGTGPSVSGVVTLYGF